MNKVDNKGTKTTTNGANVAGGGQSGGVVIVTGVAKNMKVQKQKGELIEQNQDGLEYSSEEEGENLHETAAGIANKQKRELAKVDHATTEYQAFRKAFYVEVPEIGKFFFPPKVIFSVSNLTNARAWQFSKEFSKIKKKNLISFEFLFFQNIRSIEKLIIYFRKNDISYVRTNFKLQFLCF